MQVFLLRDEPRQSCVRGQMWAGLTRFDILERPWLNNSPNVSCIPAGTYQVDYLHRSASGKYKRCYWIKGVPGRSAILIHSGNIVDHSKGCLIIGKRRGWLAGQRAVLNSRTALGELYDVIGPNSFTLTIVGNQQC